MFPSLNSRTGFFATMLMLIAVAMSLALSLTACSSEKKVDVNTLIQAQETARENSLYNAQRFKTTDPRIQSFSIIPNGDSTQSAQCPQGDGWATLTLIENERDAKGTKIKCSTYNKAVGCMYESDFLKKEYAEDDKHCQSTDKVPFPIAPIVIR